MATIAFASAKASPGVTTSIAALAATWPAERDLVVIEVDPAGGDLVVRFDLATEPGLVSLAAAGRRQLGPDTLLAHTQALPAAPGVDGASRRVLVAPVSAEQASASLAALRGGLAHALSALDVDVLVDCGRLDPASPAHDVATAADLLVMVARPVVAEVHHLSTRLASIAAPSVSLLLVGDRPYPVTEVAEAVGAGALGTLPADPRAAAVLTEGHPNAVRLLRRSRLMRDARSLAEGLAEWLGPPPSPPVGAPGDHGPVPTTPPAPTTPPVPTTPGVPAGPAAPAAAPARPFTASVPVPPTAPVPPPPLPASAPEPEVPSPALRSWANGRRRDDDGDGDDRPKHFRRPGAEEVR